MVRVVVKAGGGVSYGGSGVLIKSPTKNSWVLTNAHVIRDRKGVIGVGTSSGRWCGAKILAVDNTWDLALLAIAYQDIKPLKIAGSVPLPGDMTTIHGFGGGSYRSASGRVTQYVAPYENAPFEMIELSVVARNGDSGGPILNQYQELCGVLNAANDRVTVGAHVGPIRRLLARVCHPRPPVAKAPPPRRVVPFKPRPRPPAVVQRGPQGEQGPAGPEGPEGPAKNIGAVLARLDSAELRISQLESISDQPGTTPANDKPAEVVDGETNQPPVVTSYEIRRLK